MISSLLHLVGLRPRVYYTLTNFRGGGQGPLGPPPQYANAVVSLMRNLIISFMEMRKLHSAWTGLVAPHNNYVKFQQ